MATAGRKPIPNQIKELKGTLQKCRIVEGTVSPKNGRMVAPETLPARAREVFDEYAAVFRSLRIASPVFTPLVVEIALRMTEIEDLTRDIEERGLVLEVADQRGRIERKANPAAKLRSDALRHLHTLLAECGMTPSAATKVKAISKDKDAKPTGFAALGAD